MEEAFISILIDHLAFLYIHLHLILVFFLFLLLRSRSPPSRRSSWKTASLGTRFGAFTSTLVVTRVGQSFPGVYKSGRLSIYVCGWLATWLDCSCVRACYFSVCVCCVCCVLCAVRWCVVCVRVHVCPACFCSLLGYTMLMIFKCSFKRRVILPHVISFEF